MTVTRADLVAAARSYLDVPWVHQGRSRAGVDCAGLLVLVAADLGIPVEDISGYSRHPDGKTLRALLEAQLIRIDKAEAAPGDVLLMRWEVDPQHVAMVTERGIIHAHSRPVARRVVEHGLNAIWASRIVAAYRWPGVVA